MQNFPKPRLSLFHAKSWKPQTLFSKALTSVFLVFALLFSGIVSAQTVGTSHLSCDISNRNPCTSNDLQIVGISINAPACTSCTPGQTVTYPLKMTIHNGTKSERTSFALYGTLSSGATINGLSGNVFICVGKITVQSDQLLPGESALGNQTFAAGTITFSCGQDLTLTNNFLAWTDAAGTTADRCNTFLNATKCADIAPKCGTSNSITIAGPVVPPTLGGADPTCTLATGSITITPNAGLMCSFDGASTYTAYPNGGWTGLAAGSTHTVSIQRVDGCNSQTSSRTIGAAMATPNAPTITSGAATCSAAGTSTISNYSTSNTYTFTPSGPTVGTGGLISGMTVGTSYTVRSNNGSCTSPASAPFSNAATLAGPTFTVCVVQPTLCSTGSLTINASGGSGFLYTIDGTNPTASNTNNVFNNLNVGSVTTIKVKNSAGCSATPVNCADIVSNCPGPIVRKAPADQIIIEQQTTVKAFPNPFNDKVKFVINSAQAGNGALEVYNILGQKVKTIFQGFVPAGINNYELYLPSQKNFNLIYRFRMGEKQVTGKLLQIAH